MRHWWEPIGVMGTSCEWKQGERMVHALRRMERERYFTR